MAKGELAFNHEEAAAAFPPVVNFFEDGKTREVVVLDKSVVEDVGKQSGKPYTRGEWTLADAKTGEKKVLKYDFAFSDAMRDHKSIIRLETSTFKVTPTKTGDRNGYDIFEYAVEYTGESGSESPKGDEIPF